MSDRDAAAPCAVRWTDDEPLWGSLLHGRAAGRGARYPGLALTYRDERDRTTERICLPLAVVYYVEATVLAAWCELREDFRHFRADRIVACHETGDSFAGEAPRLRRNWHAVDRRARPDRSP